MRKCSFSALVAYHPAQDSIDQPLERALAVLSGDPDSSIDGGVGRSLQEHKFGNPDAQNITDAGMTTGNRPVEAGLEERVDFPQPS